jgi:hypothetical protein
MSFLPRVMCSNLKQKHEARNPCMLTRGNKSMHVACNVTCGKKSEVVPELFSPRTLLEPHNFMHSFYFSHISITTPRMRKKFYGTALDFLSHVILHAICMNCLPTPSASVGTKRAKVTADPVDASADGLRPSLSQATTPTTLGRKLVVVQARSPC